MKKKILALLAGTVMVTGILAGCGNSGKTEVQNNSTEAGKAESTTVAQTEEKKESVEMDTITVWSDNAHEQEVREKQIADFNNGEGKELGIQIDYKVYGDKYSDTIKIAAQAGEAPDLSAQIQNGCRISWTTVSWFRSRNFQEAKRFWTSIRIWWQISPMYLTARHILCPIT